MQAPLYKLDLGQVEDDDELDRSGSHGAEGKIRTAFQLASRWKAVLLLDECDMYLEKRSAADLKRNRIVTRRSCPLSYLLILELTRLAGFLQELEYYPSLLFLTTNREKLLDPAIYSRIHLTINYPSLDSASRHQIWSSFLDRESSSVSADELKILADLEMNGRRIRNIVKTARIMAKQQNRAICFKDITAVMRITEGVHVETFEH